MMSRRQAWLGLGAVASLAAGMRALFSGAPAHAAAPAAKTYEVQLSDEAWKQRLGKDRYQILRRAGTERPGSSPLNREKRAGTYACAGCSLPLFASLAKFESGTGWPSFFQPMPGAVEEHTDRSFGMRRTEVLCGRCGGHLGHVFNDGPRPTGLRYCMNGLALEFKPT
jgi:peptide-methionine (R)-S-oxide reductase